VVSLKHGGSGAAPRRPRQTKRLIICAGLLRGKSRLFKGTKRGSLVSTVTCSVTMSNALGPTGNVLVIEVSLPVHLRAVLNARAVTLAGFNRNAAKGAVPSACKRNEPPIPFLDVRLGGHGPQEMQDLVHNRHRLTAGRGDAPAFGLSGRRNSRLNEHSLKPRHCRSVTRDRLASIGDIDGFLDQRQINRGH
jgi:hypothetical protein